MCGTYTPMPLAHELHAGDVIVVQAGDVRTVQAIAPNTTYDEALILITFTDGVRALLNAGQHVHRLHPQELLPAISPPASTRPSTPAHTQ